MFIIWIGKMCWRLGNKIINFLVYRFLRYVVVSLDGCFGVLRLILGCCGWWVWVLGNICLIFLLGLCIVILWWFCVFIVGYILGKVGKEDYIVWKGKY